MLFNFMSYTDDERQMAEEHLVESIKNDLLSVPYDQLPSADERVVIVDTICECFFEKFNVMPSSLALYYLSNFVLLEDIKNPLSNKRKRENAFLSSRQIKTRYNKEYTAPTVERTKETLNQFINVTTPTFTGNIDAE